MLKKSFKKQVIRRLFLFWVITHFTQIAFAESDSQFLNHLGFEKIKSTLPSVEFASEDGRVSNLSDYSSSPLILHFWATWCESCKKELPQLRRIRESLAQVKLLLLSADNEKDFAKVKSFLKSEQLDQEVLILTSKNSNTKMMSWGLPMTYVVSKDRNLFLRIRGAKDWSQIKAEDLSRLAKILK